MKKILIIKKYLFIFTLIFFCFQSIPSHSLQIPTGSDYLPKNYENKSISMDFKGAKLSDVLKIFSQQSGLNFIASTIVSDKTINIYFDNVPVEEALDRILSANNLSYELKPGSNIFIVKENQEEEKRMMTRVYNLNFATVSSSKINKTFSGEANNSAGGKDQSNQKIPGIIETIEKLLSEEGSVVEDPRTNSIIVTDFPGRFSSIEKVINQLDIEIPQILIEVEMLDISKNTSDLLGAKFGSTPITFSGAAKKSFFPFSTDKILDIGETFGGGGEGEGEEDGGRYSASILSFEGLTLTLNFLKTQSDTKSLARPRILTLNNETARIHIKTNEAIGIAATSTTSAENHSSTVSQAERVETGVFLTVTPQANIFTKDILLAVEPKVIQATTGATYGEQTFKNPEERGAASMLKVKDGDTVVIGGLLKTDYQETGTNVPILSKIPILGSAFRHKDKREEERELIIFITPNIITQVNSENYYTSENFIREQDIPVPSDVSSRLNQQTFSASNISQDTNRLELIDEELSQVEIQGF